MVVIIKYTEYMSKFGLREEPLMLGLDYAKKVYEDAMYRGVDSIVIKGDPDVDGYLALYVALQLFKGVKGNYRVQMNEDRAHGMVDGEEYKNSLFINLDSGITEDELIKLVEDGNYVISLDHHELEYKEEGSTYLIKHESKGGYKGVIINNQYEESPPEYKFWSGTGVTLQGLCYILGKEPTEEMIVCHGITLLSDVRDIGNPIAREILEFTYNTDLVKCPFIKKLAALVIMGEDSRFRETPERIDRNFVDYKFSPYINATFQLNKGNYLISFMVTGKIKYFLDSRALRKYIFTELEGRITVAEMEHLTILMLDDLSPIDLSTQMSKVKFNYSLTNFVGVFANRYLNKGKTVMIVAKDGNEWARGSVRGSSANVDYKSLFKEAGFLAEGHLGAFGLLGLVKDNIDFEWLDSEIGRLESLDDTKVPIVVYNDLLENLEEIKKVAYENQFKLSRDFTRVIYTGFSKKYVRGNSKYAEYDIDGLSVLTFDPEVDLARCYIEPLLELGRLKLYAKPM